MRCHAFLYFLLVFPYFPSQAQVDSILLSAIKSCDIAAVKERLDEHIDVNARDVNQANALTWAVFYCDVAMVRCLVENGAKVSHSAIIFPKDARDYYNSVQGIAARAGKLALLQYLMDSLFLSPDERGVNCLTFKHDEYSPLSYAIENNQQGIAKYLIDKGAIIDIVDRYETSTPLIMAMETRQWEIFDMLLNTKVYQNKFGKEISNIRESVSLLKQTFPTKKAADIAAVQYSLALRMRLFGSLSFGYAAGLNVMARVYNDGGEYDTAQVYYNKAIALLKVLSGQVHNEYFLSLQGLAVTYYNTGQYENGLQWLEQSQRILDELYGKDYCPDEMQGHAGKLCRVKAAYLRAFNLTMQALQYGRWGKYDRSLVLYKQALDLVTRGMSEETPLNYWILNNMAFLYSNMGLHKEAITMYEKAIGFKRQVFAKDYDGIGGNLLDIGFAYTQTGQYKKALESFEEATHIIVKSFGKKHQYYAMILEGQAAVYERIGEHETAIDLYSKAYSIYKESVGETHPYCAKVLNELASISLLIGNYNKALALYKDAVRIRKITLTDKHPDYAQSLKNLAAVFEYKKQYDSALYLYKEALVITIESVGQSHPYYAGCLSSIASLYLRLNKSDSALRLYQEALQITTSVFGAFHPDNINILNNLGWLKQKELHADSLFTSASEIQIENLTGMYATLSEQQKITFLNNEAHQFNYIPSILLAGGGDHPLLRHQLYKNELVLKGMVLEDQKRVLKNIRSKGDATTLALYNQWLFDKAFLGKQYLLPKAQRVTYFDSLLQAVTQQEQQLSRLSAVHDLLSGNQIVSPNSIAQKLSHGQAAIEFVRFRLFRNTWSDSIFYAALVLLPGDSIPKFEILCEEKELKRMFAFSRNSTTTYSTIKKMYGDVKEKDKVSHSLNNALYQLVWQPIEKHLKGTNDIYYSPVGLLHRISFQALSPGTSQYLIEKYYLNQVMSTRCIAFKQAENTTPVSASLWGNINYDIASAPKVQPNEMGQAQGARVNALKDLYTLATRSVQLHGAVGLPSQMREIDSIKNLLSQRDVAVSTHLGTQATETAFKAMSGASPQVIHVATHGFFLPENSANSNSDIHFENAFEGQQNPMLRSGLILAGGNYAWKGGSIPVTDEDGVLTAYEMAQLDLSKTELIILSACETALGDINGNEGVIGLQRAIKLAGIKKMIVSLWKVPDKETVELMTLFYRTWLSGQTVRQSLRNAQLKMKEKYAPFYWAAFVLVE